MPPNRPGYGSSCHTCRTHALNWATAWRSPPVTKKAPVATGWNRQYQPGPYGLWSTTSADRPVGDGDPQMLAAADERLRSTTLSVYGNVREIGDDAGDKGSLVTSEINRFAYLLMFPVYQKELAVSI